ncbi:M23 family metallopeptidase [Sphingorhabdus wooponensis]|jgi:murein DD-endopeptidase MepM/ murein hydrolase activator NlpD|uniref:M23 family metallopeptidase n=1 Tax=Sphingorhabdus wooponensis TaxID=940136 RepID=A0A3R8RB18_9SPHN|nr:M23 family metallopeptidase [Sphingorhabdus wooponensis]RRQ50925.1 M23 family metallopeptidase [Sphingorhabdus wooponensis]
MDPMSSMKFFFFIALALQLSEAAFAKAAGRDAKHYENSFSKDLANDFGEIFYRWKKANESITPLEEDSFDAPSVDKNINGSERKGDAATHKSQHAEGFFQIFSIWQEQSALKTLASTRVKPKRRGSDYSGRRMPYISSDFGLRWDPMRKEHRLHKGLDIPGAFGSSIYATASGVVKEAGWRGSYGLFVEIEHSKRVRTRYAHLSRINVALGQKVRRNDTVGFMGSTGRSTGSHLHFEIYLDGIAVDPEPFFKKPNSSFFP